MPSIYLQRITEKIARFVPAYIPDTAIGFTTVGLLDKPTLEIPIQDGKCTIAPLCTLANPTPYPAAWLS